MYDLIIRNGTIVDGTGADRYTADIAVAAGKIAAIGKIEDQGSREIDGAGLIVAPGFIDPHTHYDAQLCWDRLVTPSIWHGVTSVVVGNCGVGIAPVKPDAHSREVATRDLVLVEQIPYEVLKQGICWDWTEFPQFMDSLQRRGCALNVGFIAPLTPFRHWVMGEESMQRAATPEETGQIKSLIKDAVRQGALGFSTTTLLNHNGYKGLPLAARRASHEELAAYCNGLRELGKGIVEIAITNTGTVADAELALLDLVVRESGRPVTWLALLERDDMPSMCQDTLRKTEPYSAKGAVPQVSCRPLTLNIDMSNPALLAFDIPSWQRTKGKSREDLAAIYADPAFRAAFKSDTANKKFMFSGHWDLLIVQETATPQVRVLQGRRVADIASERGRDPLDTFLDLAIEDGAGLEYSYEAFNTAEDRVEKLLRDPRTMIALSDGGAHVDMLCDASYTTYLLGHWVREKRVFTLEEAIKRITSEPGAFFGITDRGRIASGLAADLVIFDAAKVGSARRPPEMRADLPAGGRRMITPAEGVCYAIVNGKVVLEDGQPTGDLPGQVLRSH
jgi:N-acyl-D-aspartate/D-glutamate deacylase